MNIPTIRAGEQLPEKGPAYIIGRDGYYMRKDSCLCRSVVRVKSIPDLEPVMEFVDWTAPKLPYALIEEALEFFRAVYDLHEAESITLLTLNGEVWRNEVPDQKVSRIKLDYSIPHLEGLAGTIHSHGNMDAFFSDTDHKDVADFDGLHIVLGKIDRKVPRICAGVYVNGHLFKFEPEQLIGNLPEETSINVNHPWLERVDGRKDHTRKRISNRMDIWDGCCFSDIPF